MKILVAGGPKCGKTTFAKKLGKDLGIPVRHTDDLIGSHDWSAASAEVARWIDEPGPYIIEGVAIARSLRKWIGSHHREEVPCDRVYYAVEPFLPLTTGQASMLKGVVTVWTGIVGELRKRGVPFGMIPPA